MEPTESNVRRMFGPEQSALSDGGQAPAELFDAQDEGPIDVRAALAIAGDEDSLRALWSDHRRWVAAILLAHKPRWADVEDLLQEVALSFVRKVHEIRDPRALKPWLRTVALNAAHAAARSGKVRTWATGRQSSDPGFEADQRAPASAASVEEQHERQQTA
ncbi:MAG: RNA polymerase sigma factor, partial [Phycisphaerales bacterium]